MKTKIVFQPNEVPPSVNDAMQELIPGSEVREISTLSDGSIEVEISIPLPDMTYTSIKFTLDPQAPRDNTEGNAWEGGQDG